MQTDLDDLLTAAAPPVAARTPALRDAMAELVDRTEGADRSRRRVRRTSVGVAAMALTAVAGVGTAAAAGAIGWWDSSTGWWAESDAVTHRSVTDSGQPCRFVFAPRAVRDPDHPVAKGERAAAMSAAADFLRRLDYSTVDGLTADATYDEVNAQLARSLSRQGLSVYVVAVALATDCETGTQR
jgi:hypothetical protein